MDKLGTILFIIFLGYTYIKAPEISGLSKDNPKIKTVRRMQIVFLIFTIAKEFLPWLNLDNIGVYKTNTTIAIAINAIIIMYFGNILPKVVIYENLGNKVSWAVGDEKTWRKATKIFAYLSFIIAVSMFILSFYFEPSKVVILCQLAWVGTLFVYLLIYYYNKFKLTETK